MVRPPAHHATPRETALLSASCDQTEVWSGKLGAPGPDSAARGVPGDDHHCSAADSSRGRAGRALGAVGAIDWVRVEPKVLLPQAVPERQPRPIRCRQYLLVVRQEGAGQHYRDLLLAEAVE